jgi:membrane protein DedA with SNARE-associated domain
LNNNQRQPGPAWYTWFTRQRLARLGALLMVVALSVGIYAIRDQVEALSHYGYAGVFVLAFLAYATVILPAPGIAIIFTLGGVLNPVGVGLAAGAGAALGEISGYLAGYSGRAVFERVDLYERLSQAMRKNGPLVVLVLAAIPNPIADLSGMAAGALKMPISRFLFWCWLGETIKMLIFAYAGSGLLGWIGG